MNILEFNEEYGKTEFIIPDNKCYTSKNLFIDQKNLVKFQRIFIEAPDVANLLGMYPKTDNSHGFAFYQTYEMYRDFQENTPNSDVSLDYIIFVSFFEKKKKYK